MIDTPKVVLVVYDVFAAGAVIVVTGDVVSEVPIVYEAAPVLTIHVP